MDSKRLRAGPAVTQFRGEHAYLSNFYPSPIHAPSIWADAGDWPTVEHAFQAAKAVNSWDRQKIFNAPSPGQAKRLGNVVELRRDWQYVRLKIMDHLVSLKFGQHKDLRRLLLLSGNRDLIEGNHWGDTFWGVCGGRGRNELGIILMCVRARFRGTRYTPTRRRRDAGERRGREVLLDAG